MVIVGSAQIGSSNGLMVSVLTASTAMADAATANEAAADRASVKVLKLELAAQVAKAVLSRAGEVCCRERRRCARDSGGGVLERASEVCWIVLRRCAGESGLGVLLRVAEVCCREQ